MSILLILISIILFHLFLILGLWLISSGLFKNQPLLCLLGIFFTGILLGMIWWLLQKESIKDYKSCFVCYLKQKPNDFNLCCQKCGSCCQCPQKKLSSEQLELRKLRKEQLEKENIKKEQKEKEEKNSLLKSRREKENEKTTVKEIEAWKQQNPNQSWEVYQKEIEKRFGRVATIAEYLEWEKAKKTKEENKNS